MGVIVSGVEFPITNLLDHDRSVRWIIQHFHPEGFGCPRCSAAVEDARSFRQAKRSQLTVYRCLQCDTPYNLYTGTIFQQHHLTPRQVILLLRGICKGESSAVLAAELDIDYQTVLNLRHVLQENAERAPPNPPLPDRQTETDEMLQNAGEKR